MQNQLTTRKISANINRTIQNFKDKLMINRRTVVLGTLLFPTVALASTNSTTTSVTPGSVEDFIVNVGDRVLFAFDRYDLSTEAMSQLQRQVEWLKKYPKYSLTIEGHTDERGTREYNLSLGELRATAVKNYLSSLGIDHNRIQTISYGKERPAVIGANEAAWSQNRRAVTILG
jgi:peptidoglycan-associated lipoprotein